MCFAFRTTGSGEGNVVIGVRKKVSGWEKIPVEKREYLWIWHIWITDYDPKAVSNDGDDLWKYQDVPGGEVQRYPTSAIFTDEWSCVMDRNLGATKTVNKRAEINDIYSDIVNGKWQSRIYDAIKTFGMYYQYGRKDPFPFYNSEYQPVYDIKGRPIEAFNGFPNMNISRPHEVAGTNPMNHAIKHPYKFYTCSEDVIMGELEAVDSDDESSQLYLLRKSSWTGSEIGIDDWMNPGIETYSGKSLFDPCPEGWVMPNANDLFGEMDTDNEVDYLEPVYNAAGGEVNNNYFATLLLYDMLNKDKFVYFPAAGNRDGVSGGVLKAIMDGQGNELYVVNR